MSVSHCKCPQCLLSDPEVSVVKNGRSALDTRWRGSYKGLCAVLRLVIHMCALQERMLGLRYDVFGPWPVCPDHIARRYI